MIQDFIQNQDTIIKNAEHYQIDKWMIPNPNYVELDNLSLMQAAQVILASDAEFIPVVGKEKEPLGVITAKSLLKSFTHNEPVNQAFITDHLHDNFSIVHVTDPLMKVSKLSYPYYLVVDNQNKLVGLLTRNEITNGLSQYISEMNQLEHSAEILNVILDSAYEGITVVDTKGTIVEFNDAYSRYTGIEKKDAIGHHVQEVIDNTNLHNTIRTGMPERGAIQYIQGQAMIVHRIPIWKQNQVVGAIGMLVFEGVTELNKIYERLQKKSSQPYRTGNAITQKWRETNMFTLDQIIGNSNPTSELKHLARKVAKTNATVLITGESGTGKEMYAQSIHQLSPYASGNFISVNCGAIPEQLFESELFGYEEGAFTGAKKGGKPGKLEMAQYGTLFLDEIGEMPLLMQTKLLRVLQQKEFERVGGTRKNKLDTRIIAATNQNLKEMVDKGDFREDLYYRINVIELPIPPLRKRKEDIPPLVSYYLSAACNKHQIPLKELSSEVITKFINYDWRGNIRQLFNVIENLVVLVESDTIEPHHLPDYMLHTDQTLTIGEDSFHQMKTERMNTEKEMIVAVLRKNNGNKSETAKTLGIHRTTLYYKLKKYDLI
ncbi:sigma-54-dependent Fis family transcriptional regulator [Virgibacillus siamensis]|uniref:sigma-54-dependent Fis family transcriptional regulator n=1 Tax=Virgibacillus siamensis TaxID=480071 RepID=UPI000984C418|nr:sigma-54-dependent Fis family transcriptional regulator [Virgibacillus siamensis]